MAMTRKVLDSFKWKYWVFCDNSAVSIVKDDMGCSLRIEPGKVIFNDWGNYSNITYTDQIIGKSKYVMAVKRTFVDDWVDSDTGDISQIERSDYVILGELKVENRTDFDYLKTFGNSLEEMIDEIKYYNEKLNDNNSLEESQI